MGLARSGGRSFCFCSKVVVNPRIAVNFPRPLIRALDSVSGATAPVEPPSDVAVEYRHLYWNTGGNAPPLPWMEEEKK